MRLTSNNNRSHNTKSPRRIAVARCAVDVLCLLARRIGYAAGLVAIVASKGANSTHVWTFVGTLRMVRETEYAQRSRIGGIGCGMIIVAGDVIGHFILVAKVVVTTRLN